MRFHLRERGTHVCTYVYDLQAAQVHINVLCTYMFFFNQHTTLKKVWNVEGTELKGGGPIQHQLLSGEGGLIGFMLPSRSRSIRSLCSGELPLRCNFRAPSGGLPRLECALGFLFLVTCAPLEIFVDEARFNKILWGASTGLYSSVLADFAWR